MRLLVGIILGTVLGSYWRRIASIYRDRVARAKPVSGGIVTRYRDLFAPLGELTIAFSAMEGQLDNAIRVLKELQHPEAARMAVDQDIKTKIRDFDAAASRAVATVPTLKAEIPALIRALHDARGRRNRAQHGPWLSIDQETGSVAKVGRRGKPFEWHDHTPASLRSDARFCFDVMGMLAIWTARYTDEVLVARNTTRSSQPG
jgi:hypothetical protein